MTKPKYGYSHVKKRHKKRKGKHSKNANKRIPRKNKTRGQGK